MQRESTLLSEETPGADGPEPYRASSGSFQPEDDENDLNLPPGRMHATRRPSASGSEYRLRGKSTPDMHYPGGSMINLPMHSSSMSGGPLGGSSSNHSTRQRSSSDSSILLPYPASPRSRSRSPSVKDRLTTTTADGNSSISSLEDVVDSDILYDRAGLAVDEWSQHSSTKMSLSREFINLPPVNERLSEDTLEDVHAFTDIQARTSSSNASRAASITTDRELFLDPLEELDEEEEMDSLEDENESPDKQVILTNMENLVIDSPNNLGISGAQSSVAMSHPTT